jgi:hypothetical protein
MFKKVFLISAALIFASGILMASVYRASAQATVDNSEATPPAEIEATQASETIEESEEKEEVEYSLTWPGILPDHFLYPVKMVRDRIWLFLTTDVVKKAELLLKLADKRIWSAQMLIEAGKDDLGASTATKAEKYLERAVAQAKLAKEKGRDVTGLLDNLAGATQKHEEVLLAVRKKVSDSSRGMIDAALEYPRRGFEEVKKMLEE